MKLEYLHLAAVKQFRQPLHLDNLADGINLFVGPNESGKSTLVDAIRAAFFERYKSGGVDYLQPWGDSSAAPEVGLAFHWKGEHWVLNKRFLNKPRCDLIVGRTHFSETEAEDKLAELFGYQFALKGTSRPEHQGVPGLLWVKQGSIQEIRGPVTHAGDQLQAALGTSLGEVASSVGDDLTDALEKERGRWLTRTGRPTGDYKMVMDTCDAGRAQLAELDTQIAGYRSQVDELGRLREQRQTIDQPQPWQAERGLAEEAQKRLGEVRGWQAQQQHDKAKLQNSEGNQALCRQQLQDFDADRAQLTKRASANSEAKEKVDAYQARQPQLEVNLQQAQAAYSTAKVATAEARQQAERARLQEARDTVAADLARNRKRLLQARDLQKSLAGLRDQWQASAIDEKMLAKLKRNRSKLDELAIRRESLATRLQFDLQSGKSLVVGSESVIGKGERLLLEATKLAIPEVGTLFLQPGGTDVAALAREQQHVQGQHDALLRELGITTLADGERRADMSREFAVQIDREQARLQGLVPSGVDALAAQCQLDAKRLSESDAKLTALPEASSNAVDETTAERELEAAQSKLNRAEQACSDLNRELAVANQVLAASVKEWQQLNDKVESSDYKARVKDTRDRLVGLNSEAAGLADAIQGRQQQINAAQPEALQQDVERYTRSAEAMRHAATDRQQAIDRLEAKLETLGAQGLDEKRAALQQAIEANQLRSNELSRHTTALNLLLDLLKGKRRALTCQLQAPLQKHLDHYLRLLFPHASLTVDDALMPEVLTRQSTSTRESGDMEDLSYGTLEQMGLISRLAYADLLREADKPTLIILDDALVHSDPERLKQMKRILFDAATRHQILLFSCHPDNWRDLGVSARDLQALKASPA